MGSVKVAIVGVGNCAASLVQGVHYYRDADATTSVPGLMHVRFGDYHVSDVEFVAAFDVDAKKVGRDLSEAIVASENNTITICDVPPLGVTVQRGTTLDGLGKYYRATIEESDEEPVDVVAALRESGADVRLRVLEGRRRTVERQREGLRASLSRTRERLDRYTLELQRHGLDSVDREVRWLAELIDRELDESQRRRADGADPGNPPVPPDETPPQP